VAVFRNADDEVFALLDRCPHKGGPLSQGIVFGTRVACPLHNWTIGLADGCAQAPDEGCTPRFAVKVAAGVVHLDSGELATHATDLPRPVAGPCAESAARMTETRSTCPYCGVGCGVVIQSQGAQITGVRGDPDHPANFGRLCTKGSTLHLTASAPRSRARRACCGPCSRAARGDRRRSRWHGTRHWTSPPQVHAGDPRPRPRRGGFYLSGQLLTEDYYVFNKLAKGLIGTNNIDTNSRLCMSSAVAGYKQTLGADAPPACYDDLNHARLPVHRRQQHRPGRTPFLFRRIEDARRANPA
jgi:assimilatory nitrate reductase catalytic subunit